MSEDGSETLLSFSPDSPPPQNVGERRRVFSVAFAWREGSWNAAGNGRKSVRWYADCLIDFVYNHAKKDDRCRFVIHMHGAIPNAEEIAGMARRAFYEGRGREEARGVRIEICDENLPPMWPQAERVATLIDNTSNSETVVLCDVHDDTEKQVELIRIAEEAMEEEGKGAFLTFWKAEGLLAESFLGDAAVLPPPLLRVERSSAMAERDEHYSLDAGFAITTGHFRSELRRMEETYSSFLKRMSSLVNYDETRGTDESLMKLYLLTQNQEVVDLVRRRCVLFTHTLRRRSKDPPRRVEGNYPPPSYKRLPLLPLSFAYDAEAESRLRLRRLEWEEKRPNSKRPKRK